MTDITLVFDTEDGLTEVLCTRVEQLASDVQVGDFVICPHTGFIHVHKVHTSRMGVHLTDCHGSEHIYAKTELLDIARPQTETACDA